MAKSGVSLCTVLGPLIILIYISFIESQLTSSICLFADDRAHYRQIHSLTLQEDIYKLLKWESTWQMTFNINKCKLLCIAYCRSIVIKHVYNMYQVNALSDNISPTLALLVEKQSGFSVPTTYFINIK